MRNIKHLFIVAAVGLVPVAGMSQAAVDLYNLSRPDLRGTARFMSMGGAFTALGGDISSLNQNPAGIGVYRSSEIGMTLNLDFQSTSTEAQGSKISDSQTRFSFNNFGYIGSISTMSDVMPTFSWGATYARTASFDRIFTGGIGNLNGASLSNYVAALTNSEGIEPGEMLSGDNYNPWLDGNAPWLSTLAYQGYMINDSEVDGKVNYSGLMGNGTTGSASFQVREKGYVDEYSINFGGNLYNTVYWGIGLGITDINYTQFSYYQENLDNAYIAAESKVNGEYNIVNGKADYRLSNYLNSNGSGFNLKLGVIVKPINELRFGFAVHTPTWYSMTDTYWGTVAYRYTPQDQNSFYDNMTDRQNPAPETNDGYDSWNDYNMRTPWRMMFGVAGVIGGQGILSLDYEYRGTSSTHISDVQGEGYINDDMKTYFKGTNILRLGAEYRITPQFSLRAGYSWESSPVKKEAANDGEVIWTAGTIPSYTFDKTTQYITAGLGYRYKGFYADLAYVHKNRESTYHAFSPVLEDTALLQGSPSAKVTDNNNQVILSLGYKF